MSHIERARAYLDVAAGHLRIAVDDEEVTPVDAVLCDALLMGWRRDRGVLAEMVEREG